MDHDIYIKLIILAMVAFGSPCLAQKRAPKSGSSSGVITKVPEWSLGIQAGTWSNTGIAVQKLNFERGALNFSLGFGSKSLILAGDYIILFNQNFRMRRVKSAADAIKLRGRVLPYAGLGAQIGDGIGLRLPFGAQYTMVADPVNFFGGLVILAGPKFDTDPVLRLFPALSIWVGALIGARIMM